jgi:DUF3006 family protein
MEVVKASLDRIEGNYAVVYSDSDRKYDIPLELLPQGSKPGNRLIVKLDGDRVADVIVDEKATEDAKERIKRKYEKLRKGKHIKK